LSVTAAQSRAGGLWGLVLAMALLFVATLWLDSRANGFPFFYHPDEPDKVDQLITGKWNFHHPLLMLGSAELVKKALGVPDEEQRLVVMGRWCSAAYVAAGVTCFAMLAWRVRGWGAFWMVGLLLVTQHQLYELAHYFKEDASFFFAIAVALLALESHHRKAGAVSALLLGAACGLCISAKYLGAIMIVPAAVIMIAAQRGKRIGAMQWPLLVVGIAAAVAVINFPVFANFDVFVHSFGRESKLVEEGQQGYTGGQVALFEYLHMLVYNTTPVILLLIAMEIVARRGKRDAFEWTMTIFPFAFIALLSCSTKTNDRYFLPITGMLHYLAGLGIVDWAAAFSPMWQLRLRKWMAPALAVLALVANGFTIWPYVTAFAHDDRTEMLAWVRANVPANATIAGEDRADLPTADRPERLAVQPLLSQRVVQAKRYMADLADTPEALAATGVDYIVISESDYGVFFRKAAGGHLSESFQKKRAFYDSLFKDYKPLWARERGTGIYLHPGLMVYRIGKS
jgi:4-amino-4-deoxy-L-arabinose transferase-like glycosyltransferase